MQELAPAVSLFKTRLIIVKANDGMHGLGFEFIVDRQGCVDGLNIALKVSDVNTVARPFMQSSYTTQMYAPIIRILSINLCSCVVPLSNIGRLCEPKVCEARTTQRRDGGDP